MGKRRDITGLKFGRLTALRHTGNMYNGQTIWECICECGNTTLVPIGRLTTKYSGTRSCGCLRELTQNGRNVFVNNLYRKYKTRHNKDFTLTEDEFETLILSPCFYCGAEPQGKMVGWKGKTFAYNGIDRVDNLKGYHSENCVACCKWCNASKSNRPIEEFRQWVIDLYENWILED